MNVELEVAVKLKVSEGAIPKRGDPKRSVG